jgi:pyruvate formate-lyase activating enzyme-like uncharacterized protein
MDARAKKRHVAANKSEYGRRYDDLRWITDEDAKRKEAERAALLSRAIEISSEAKGTKPHFGKLSPGCLHCLGGTWSCLFVTGRCNCRCFYCPTRQDQNDIPVTQTLQFPRPREYVEYLERFGFKGVGLSGGEPLLSFESTRRFVSTIKRRMGDDVHLWLYTNGTLLTKERATALADAGLDEIRFDIGATDYRLEKARLAVGVIDTVTIEIPAVPEELDRLKDLLAHMRRIGIDHLNLHQLRLTPHNFSNLASRGYTFSHGRRVTVVESELAALSLLKHTSESAGIPLNYCSYVYKNRYQSAAERARPAKLIKKGYEDLTENGFIRRLTLTGEGASVCAQAARLERSGVDRSKWELSSSGQRLDFAPDVWSFIGFDEDDETSLEVRYFACRIVSHLSYKNLFSKVELPSGRSLYVERAPAARPIELPASEIVTFAQSFFSGAGDADEHRAQSPGIEAARDFEWIRPGLQEYF